ELSFPVLVVRKRAAVDGGCAAGAAVQERHDTRWIAVWRRLQDDRSDDAEDCDVGADAERQGDDGGRGESWCAPQQPERVADVAADVPNPRAALRRRHR